MRRPAYPAFGLTLVVNHACNLRCTYCYTGAKVQAPMPRALGERAIARALASIAPGGSLQLGFFGGEPLLEAETILAWMRYARRRARESGKSCRFNLTTNGTITSDEARAVMMDPDLELAVSHDGTSATHDLHRRDVRGNGSSAAVESCLRELVRVRRSFSVVMVVRPDTLFSLAAGLAHLHSLGVTRFTLSPDVWTRWDDSDLANLANAISSAADLWRIWLPTVSIDWFDTRIAALAALSVTGPDLRCAFGEGEVAVAPSGRLYPCERLVGEDPPDHPLRLASPTDDTEDFLQLSAPCQGAPGACDSGSGCRCSNYLRTGSTRQADRLLATLDEAVHRALERLINATVSIPPIPS